MSWYGNYNRGGYYRGRGGFRASRNRGRGAFQRRNSFSQPPVRALLGQLNQRLNDFEQAAGYHERSRSAEPVQRVPMHEPAPLQRSASYQSLPQNNYNRQTKQKKKRTKAQTYVTFIGHTKANLGDQEVFLKIKVKVQRAKTLPTDVDHKILYVSGPLKRSKNNNKKRVLLDPYEAVYNAVKVMHFPNAGPVKYPKLRSDEHHEQQD